MANAIKKEINRHANQNTAAILSRFFKTGAGEYGEGDRFLGVSVPQLRAIAKMHRDAPLAHIQELLVSALHEHRMAGLIILADQYTRAGTSKRRVLVRLYLRNIAQVNNWDLVDESAPRVLGDWLRDRDPSLLSRFAHSKNLWKRRIAIIATFAFIRNRRYKDTLALARILLNDPHDLIHKAVGWMLREVGNRDPEAEERFLKKQYKKMPRTMLRYAIEKFPRAKRKKYLHGLV